MIKIINISQSIFTLTYKPVALPNAKFYFKPRIK